MTLQQDYLTLFRADRKGNKTMPEKYYSDGLLTKQVGSGDDPEPHKKYGWLKTISSHILPLNKEEDFIYYTTQFLSFTTDENQAFFFLSNGHEDEFIKSVRNDADGFIFKAKFNTNKLIELGSGLYYYYYNCNYDKTKFDRKFTPKSFIHFRCNLCSQSPDYIHKLLLIDAKKFLSNKRDQYPDQYYLAKQDSEYLLMPLDIMSESRFNGFQSRIQIADFWDVEYYKIICQKND